MLARFRGIVQVQTIDTAIGGGAKRMKRVGKRKARREGARRGCEEEMTHVMGRMWGRGERQESREGKQECCILCWGRPIIAAAIFHCSKLVSKNLKPSQSNKTYLRYTHCSMNIAVLLQTVLLVYKKQGSSPLRSGCGASVLACFSSLFSGLQLVFHNRTLLHPSLTLYATNWDSMPMQVRSQILTSMKLQMELRQVTAHTK